MFSSTSLDHVLSLVTSSRAAVLTVADELDALLARPPSEREMAERLAACAATLRAIGGPTDPNKPAGALPTHPTTLGAVWVGDTRPDPVAFAAALDAEMVAKLGPPHDMVAPNGPRCSCGASSTHESGWCGCCFPPRP